MRKACVVSFPNWKLEAGEGIGMRLVYCGLDCSHPHNVACLPLVSRLIGVFSASKFNLLERTKVEHTQLDSTLQWLYLILVNFIQLYLTVLHSTQIYNGST